MFSPQGVPLQFGRVKYGEDLQLFLDILLDGANLSVFIIEEFQVRTANNYGKVKHYTPEWDRVVAARAIGAIERKAHEIGVPVHWQYPHQLGPASQAFGISLTKFRSAQHPVDAVLHGLYYAWKELGILPPEHPVGPDSSTKVQPDPGKSETAVVPISSFADLRKAGSRVEKHRRTGRPLR